mgnify:CR=1 FL=1
MVSFSGPGSLELTFQDQDTKIRNPLIGGYPSSAGLSTSLPTQNPSLLPLNSQSAASTKKKKKGKEISLADSKTSKDGPTTLKQEIINW